jgi:hypothetical protein
VLAAAVLAVVVVLAVALLTDHHRQDHRYQCQRRAPWPPCKRRHHRFNFNFPTTTKSGAVPLHYVERLPPVTLQVST